jgi:nitrogen fixation/metabolism regulation signal transduction histidine kinase
MRLRVLAISLATALGSLLLATSAFASSNGEGLWGETNDRVVTVFGLGLVLLFTLIVVLGSAIQGHFDKRKAEKKAAQLRQRAGW